jgi:hypothetical protein
MPSVVSDYNEKTMQSEVLTIIAPLGPTTLGDKRHFARYFREKRTKIGLHLGRADN